MTDQENWIRIALDLSELSFNKQGIARVEVAGKPLCIARSPRGLKACSALCPHAGADLSDGLLDKKGNIICSLHDHRFSLDTGRDVFDEGYFLKIYPLRQSPDGVFVKLG